MDYPTVIFEDKPRVHYHRWGEVLFVHRDQLCTVKLLTFYPGDRTSTHYHLYRKEKLFILEGTFILRTINQQTGVVIERRMVQGYQYEIPSGCIHQVQAIQGSGKILETTENYTEEDVLRIVAPTPSQVVEEPTGPSLR